MKFRLTCAITLGFAIAGSALAQTRPTAQFRLTVEDALRWRMASSPVLSPDGKRVAYLVAENDFEKSRNLSRHRRSLAYPRGKGRRQTAHRPTRHLAYLTTGGK